MNYNIKIFGIGGGGSNTTDFIIKSKLKGIETYSVNTDAQALENANAQNKIHIGKELTKGLGAGALPEIGRKAAEESHEELMNALKGADIVFIASGMGGGTGTGAAPYIAELSKSLGILTIAVVTKPFAFEGVSRMNMAIDGLKRLETQADVTIVIPNEKLIENHKDKYIEDAFVLPDDILKTAVDSIIRMLDAVSNVGANVDLNTLKAALKDKGLAVMGIGESEASDLTPAENLQEALKKAIDSNILEISIKGATQFIVLIGGNLEYLTPSEAEDVINFLAGKLNYPFRITTTFKDIPEADESFKSITLIATGYDSTRSDLIYEN